MELEQDLPIFDIINKYLGIEDDSKELVISFHNTGGQFTELEFNNFTNTFRSLGYDQVIEKECLEATNGNDIMMVEGLPHIIKYCVTNATDSNKTKWFKTKEIMNENVNDLFDIDIGFSLSSKTVSATPDNWDDIRKTFVVRKYIIYKKDNIEYVASLYKESHEAYNTLNESKTLKNTQNYTFKIIIKGTHDHKNNDIIGSIIRTMQSISMSSMLLTKKQQSVVLDQYRKLIINDVEISAYNKKTYHLPLITPKPVTLEKINMIDPKEYGAVSILNGYTVTEKADGERILMYVNNIGKVYLINNSYRVEDTGITVSQAGYNSLIDGEFILCNKRQDDSSKNLYAAFDMYYIGGKQITSLPLIDDKESRYKYLKNFEKLITKNTGTMEFFAKEHIYSDNILLESRKILNGSKNFPYEVDGLIFTPSKLALYSYYTNNPVKLTDNVKWDRVFKWKPSEQNTIDFLITINRDLKKNGVKFSEAKLHVSYNASQWEDIDIETGLKLSYDYNYAKTKNASRFAYIPILFKPQEYYAPGIECAHIKHNSKSELRAENGDKIESHSIVEFRYDNDPKISISERWKPIRVRDDKTRMYRKGTLSKTANDMSVALNIWRSIHNPVTKAMIMGNEPVFNKEAFDNETERLLESDDVYYSRTIPRNNLLSVHMLNFHNQGIKKMLYDKPNVKGKLLELCCGEAGDLSRWLDSGYSFVFGVDFVKRNIYNPKSGCYSRMLKMKSKFRQLHKGNTTKVYFPDMVFAAGDCSLRLKDGTSAALIDDSESEKIMKNVLNGRSSGDIHLKHIYGKGSHGFDAVSCMFAIHYFFESENKLDGFLSNVSDNLKVGGKFFCTFMNGDKVISEITRNGGDYIEGKKLQNEYESGMPIWAIIRRFNKELNENEEPKVYGKKIDVYIENTQKFIPEYLVSFTTLREKALQYNLELTESEMFHETFNRIKESVPESETEHTHLHQDVLELDKDEVQKQFSFLNQWAVFKKIKA